MIERFREWYVQECDANAKMLDMLASVPLAARTDERYVRAVNLAAHLAACRENWLIRIRGSKSAEGPWFPESVDPLSLKPRFRAIELEWRQYLEAIDDEVLASVFEGCSSEGVRYRWSIEVLVTQLVGHAFYHRGQVALLVAELGGHTVDTDYLFWAIRNKPGLGRI